MRFNLVSLAKGQNGRLSVKPRGFRRRVLLSPTALYRLELAQAALPSNIQLILLRGYESGSLVTRLTRKTFRSIGNVLFQVLFPERSIEACEIFGSNGHDLDGNHLDVAVAKNGKRKRLLPLGVFTPSNIVSSGTQDASVRLVWEALEASGFRVHSNPTEALQIHCDLC